MSAFRVAHVSTLPPLRCGIASYTADLIHSMHGCEHARYALNYGEPLPVGAAGGARVGDPADAVQLAITINNSRSDVVSLQHEFGIWGGTDALRAFLDTIRPPIVSTLHTTFPASARPREDLATLAAIAARSARVIVLTEASRRTLLECVPSAAGKVVVIPHGIPAATWRQPPALAVLRLCSIGYFRPDKGIEHILAALTILKREGFKWSYSVVGTAQPQFDGQHDYRSMIRGIVSRLDLQNEVTIEDRYVSVGEQIAAIQRSHAAVFAYQNPAQASSGTMPLALSCGRVVVSTPFQYALAKGAELPGVFVADDFSAAALVKALRRCASAIKSDAGQFRMLYERTRVWSWTYAANLYREQFVGATRDTAPIGA